MSYRACVIAGFYLAVITALGGTLIAGYSLFLTALLAVVCGLSFSIYAYIRKWIAGREVIMLLEPLWFTFGCAAGVLFLLGEPLLPYLDIVSVGMCFFLAMGRVGCTLAGYCHGQPSSVGIIYNEACVYDGFPAHLAGVRLFPVPAIEAISLIFIGITSLTALPFATPGKIFIWFLLAYSVVRLGLEGLRGDRRPHLLGLSQARWMCLAVIVFALHLVDGRLTTLTVTTYASLLISLLVILSVIRIRNRRRRIITAAHARELRKLVTEEIERNFLDRLTAPVLRVTSQGVSIRVSSDGEDFPFSAHVSLLMPDGCHDLLLLCELGVFAFPESLADAAHITGGKVLHLPVPMPLVDANFTPKFSKELAQTLYGQVVRQLQHDAECRSQYSAETTDDYAQTWAGTRDSRSWCFYTGEPARRR
jgi:hypothetical protein